MSDETVQVPVALLRELREWCGGTPGDLLARLIALIPPPRKRPTGAAVQRYLTAVGWYDSEGNRGVAGRALQSLIDAGLLAPEWTEDDDD